MAVIWLVVLSVIELPFEAWYNASGGGASGTIAGVVGAIVGIAWTVLAARFLGKFGSASYYEKQRWQRQEDARLRKKAWKEGR